MKEKITETSILLFGKKGFSQTSIQDIVTELHVTKGTFYYHFPSKEQLLMDIHQDYITNLIARQELIVHDRTYSQQDKLTAIIRLLINDIADKGPSARVFSREVRHLGPKNMQRIKQDRDQFRLNIETVIKAGMQQGELKADLRADMIAFGILGVTNWSYNWFKTDGDVSEEELVTIFSEMILTGIGS